MSTVKAFISYSHEDSELLEKLIVHLAALKRESLIDTWTDKEIHAGGVIDDHVDAAMEEAQLFLLLVSASFIHSDYCYAKEFTRAQERHAAGEATIVPIIVRECDWKIPALRKFKALPKDGKAIISRHWHTPDEAFADVASGLRKLLEAKKRPPSKKTPSPKFVPDEHHVTKEQKDKLNALCKDVVERMTAKSATESESVVKARTGKWFGIIWAQFHEEFGTKEHGLQSLEREKFDAAKSWFVQYRASKDKNFKRVNPQKYRNTLTTGIFSNAGKLGWSDEEVREFAGKVLGRSEAVASFKDLGNNQLELIRDRVRYEHTKRTSKTGQARARKKPKFAQPKSPEARQLLEAILAHEAADQRGLTEILRDSPSGPLDICFIPNTTARGNVSMMRKAVFRPALAELIQLGWLLQPEGNASVRIYELNPQTQN